MAKMKLLKGYNNYDEHLIWHTVELQSHGDNKGSIFNHLLDWDIEESNKEWHERFFTKKAIKDHQAKANCCFVDNILRRMNREELIHPKMTTILDPMCGAGTMLVVAGLQGYNAFGIELEEKYMKNLAGYNERDLNDDTFWDLPYHTEGVLEKYDRLTANVKSVGIIKAIQGDAREIHNLVGKYLFNYNFAIVMSPPYGNRMRDEGQKIGSKPGVLFTDYKGSSEEYKTQYSNNPDNIGTNKLAIVTSPPYGGVSEHDEDKVESMSGNIQEHSYTHPNNIAVLMDNDYAREMLKVYQSFSQIERLDYVCLITRDFIMEGQIVYLSALTVELMHKAGFKLIDIWRARLPDVSLFKRLNYNKFHEQKGLPLFDWEEATIYTRSD